MYIHAEFSSAKFKNKQTNMQTNKQTNPDRHSQTRHKSEIEMVGHISRMQVLTGNISQMQEMAGHISHSNHTVAEDW